MGAFFMLISSQAGQSLGSKALVLKLGMALSRRTWLRTPVGFMEERRPNRLEASRPDIPLGFWDASREKEKARFPLKPRLSLGK
jgi:hypothetical protein